MASPTSPEIHCTGAVHALLALVSIAVSAAAQHQFVELAKRGLPTIDDASTAIAQGDVDGDGDVDLILANRNSQDRLYLNDGAGVFSDGTATRMPVAAHSTLAVALGDLDSDGDLDVVFASDGQNRLLVNDGSGTFTDVTAARLPGDRDKTKAIALADFDGDGDLDLALGNDAGRQDRLYLNDGTGRYSDATTTWMPTESDDTPAVAAADLDADGDLDLVLGGATRPVRLYINNGNRTFVDTTSGRVPNLSQWWPYVSSFAIGDVDQDADLDLVIGSFCQTMLLLNNGTATFTDATATLLPGGRTWLTSAVLLGDIDGDRDLDLFLATAESSGRGQDQLLINQGPSGYTDGTSLLPFDDAATASAVFADVDADGDLDLAAANGIGLNQLNINDGTGRFFDATAPRLDRLFDTTLSLATADMDGDGDLDIVFGNDTYKGLLPRTRLCINDGSGVFTNWTAIGGDAHALAAGDVDGDGDLDLAIGQDGWYCVYGPSYGQNSLMLNDGTGGFVPASSGQLPAICDNTRSVAFGDVDRDGDLDLVVGNYYEQDRLLCNDGTGTFTDATTTHMPVDVQETSFATFGDVDRDGDLDLVLGANGYVARAIRLYLNDGTGVFSDATATRMPAIASLTCDGELGDVDSDGDLDIVLCNARTDRIYLNDGAGTFSVAGPAALPPARGSPMSMALGDLDDDGDLDIVRATWTKTYIYLNDGTGVYQDATDTLLGDHNDGTTGVALGDFDGDGDLDITVGNFNTHNRIYSNLLRQIDTPYLLRPGHAFQLDLYARQGRPNLLDVAAPFFATAPASLPVPPFGVLGLAPTQMVQLPPVVIPQPAGLTSLQLRVPNVPVLTGLSGHAQALIIPYPYSARLTHATTDVLIR